MLIPIIDDRPAERRAQDEEIAAEPPLPPPELPADAQAFPVEKHLPQRRPVAVAGIVENGLVRPLDASVKLRESGRVIIVTSE